MSRRASIDDCLSPLIGCRPPIFSPSALVDDVSPGPACEPEGVGRFLVALHEVKTEVEERLPGYFDYHALRCWAPDGALVSLAGARPGAGVALATGVGSEPPDGRFEVASATDVAFSEFCERVGMAYDISLLAVCDRALLNAVDRLFEQRHAGFVDCLARGRVRAPADLATCASPLAEPAKSPADRWLEEVRREQDAAHARRRQRVERLPRALEEHTIDTDAGPLTYYVGGAGPVPLVLLNALGQGLSYWSRLIDVLTRRHRVIIWEPRGTVSPPHPFGLADQVSDVSRVLEHDGATACHLVAWCTGPKVALEFLRRHQDTVESMVFLNSAMKCDGGPPELDSAYERNLEPVCRAIIRRPRMAASLTALLRDSSATPVSVQSFARADRSADAATAVLGMINSQLQRHVTAPFRDESSTVNYARQSIDFWSYDTSAVAADVQVPVLLVSCDQDTVASPETTRRTAGSYPRAEHVEILGATHYCLYDRPELIADLVDCFVDDPRQIASFDGRMDLRIGIG